MSSYPIHESLSGVYRGAGWALVAILDNQVVALRYIEDAAPAITDALDGDHARGIIGQRLDTQEAAAIIRELQALGQVSVGMLSGGEFVQQ